MRLVRPERESREGSPPRLEFKLGEIRIESKQRPGLEFSDLEAKRGPLGGSGAL